MSAWIWIGLLGLGTLLIRGTFLVGTAGRTASPIVTRVLRLVPAAVLSALVAPSLFYRDAQLAISPQNEHLVAGLVAGIVAWKTRNVPRTLAVGMLVMWGL